eukprot:CFRG1833T1
MTRILSTVYLGLTCIAGSAFSFSVKLETLADDRSHDIPLPNYPESYTVKGVFSLPYAEIREPVEVATDRANNRQAVSYYNGLSSYIYLGVGTKTQTSYESYIAGYEGKCAKSVTRGGPMANEVQHEATLIKYPVAFIPDLTHFKYKGKIDCGSGWRCYKWMKEDKILERTNHYTYLARVDDNYTPISYTMMGYDTTFSSHYDLYRIDYDGFSVGVEESMFEIPNNCDMPESEATVKRADHHRNLISELSALMNTDDRHVHGLFDGFVKKHGKVYKSSNERKHHRENFRKNYALINNMNIQPDGVTYAANNYMDQDIGAPRYNGYKPVTAAERESIGKPYPMPSTNERLPTTVDWRRTGCVSPVKDQGACGSCWAFSAAQTIESHWFLTTGQPVQLSEQQLVDCIWDKKYGSSGCDGGDETMAMQYVKDAGGIVREGQYVYTMQDGLCKIPKDEQVDSPAARVSNVILIPTGDEETLKHAVANKGPVSIAYDASRPTMTFYSEGVYFDKLCSSTELDHAVMVVGYGTEDGQDYWLVKNSWSTYWGDMGYFKLARNRNNHCGVATSASYPEIAI